MDEMLNDAFEALLAAACTPDVVRAIEAGGPGDGLWRTLEASGFLAALEPEAQGGAGLSPAAAFGLMLAAGRHAVPLPFAQTLLARGWLRALGAAPPEGAIALAPFARATADGCAARVGCATVADWVLAATPEGAVLVPMADTQAEPDGVPGSLAAELAWPATAGRHVADDAEPLRELAALAAAVTLAGAAERVLALAVAYAGERQQFGRPIGKFQAIQHNLAVMAEQVAAMRMAAEQACGESMPPAALPVAVGIYRNAESAVEVAAAAHAIHGAIGVTAELDLHLYTRRLLQWQTDAGSAAYWAGRIGAAALASEQNALDFLREHLVPARA